ncbi:MAG: PAS domain-containing protein, partial [Verrucomicrobia bacterium]|nr:PAS domain-containing protein [Verrucomicrobiota bacterium]
LRESEYRWKFAIEGSSLGLWDWDVTAGTCLFSNRWKEMLGLAEDEVANTIDEWSKRIHPDELAPVMAAVQAHLDGTTPHYLNEHRVRCKDGSWKWILDRGLVVSRDVDGKPLRMIGTHTDITERKRNEMEKNRLEFELRQAQKMEAVGRLAGGVAHDFNNLLMGIMGYADLCRDAVEPNHPIREYLDEIVSSVQRSAEITRQLLAFARKQTIAPKILDLNDAVSGMLKLLRRLIGEDIELTWRPGADLRPIKIDPSQIDQILANLCVNARDAITGVGEITLETGNSIIDSEYCTRHMDAIPGEYVFLAVSDNGCGMSKDTLAQVFEPFFTTKGLAKGTGLGLATVYGIVKQNNGFIYAYSESHKGTTFKIFLPQIAAEADAPVTSKAEAPRGQGEAVLLVEDEKSLRVTCGLFLKALGYKVLVAETPEEALKMVSQYSDDIHVLLTDVVMPGMDGRQLATRVIAVKPSVKVLFMSGYTADVIAKRGVLDEGVHFLAKPFTRGDLARKLHDVLEK